jgi:hypothetical protein
MIRFTKGTLSKTLEDEDVQRSVSALELSEDSLTHFLASEAVTEDAKSRLRPLLEASQKLRSMLSELQAAPRTPSQIFQTEGHRAPDNFDARDAQLRLNTLLATAIEVVTDAAGEDADAVVLTLRPSPALRQRTKLSVLSAMCIPSLSEDREEEQIKSIAWMLENAASHAADWSQRTLKLISDQAAGRQGIA